MSVMNFNASTWALTCVLGWPILAVVNGQWNSAFKWKYGSDNKFSSNIQPSPKMFQYKVRGVVVVVLVVGVSNLSLIVHENILRQQQASHFDLEMH